MLDRVVPLRVAGGADVLTVMDGGHDTEALDAVAPVSRAIEPARYAILNQHGLTLTLAFHPHALTAIETEAQIEELLDRTEIDLCLDTGHHAFWGKDPIAYLDRQRDRIAAIHLKNVAASLVQDVALRRITATQAIERGAFCPLDEGVVDIYAFLNAFGDFDGLVVVEQNWIPGASESPLSLDQAVEAELAVLLAAHASDRTDDGRARLVRHGPLPEREVITIARQAICSANLPRRGRGAGQGAPRARPRR